MAEENAGQAKPKLDLKKMLSIVFVLVNLGGVGFGAYLVYNATLGHQQSIKTEEELNKEMVELREFLNQEPIFYSMDAFTTNLDGLPRRFVKVEMAVEMYDKEGFEELVTLGGESRDSIVRILNSKKFNDVESLQGKLHLKNEIIAHLNDALERGVVKNIYFNNFHIQ
jgi:flagellar FliL protein